MKSSLSFLAAALLLTGCATPNRVVQNNNIQGLPQPTQVCVSLFAYQDEDPAPDQAALNRMNGISGSPTVNLGYAPTGQQLSASVARTLQTTLIRNLGGTGIPVYPTSAGTIPPVGTLLVEGELLTIKGGNSFGRYASGDGTGKSKVVSSVSAYLVTKSGLINLEQFYSDSKRSVNPGAAGTLLTATNEKNLATAEKHSAQADAAKTGQKIAQKLTQLMESEGWTNN